ncbi:MAG: hypothetical protein GVY10_11465 [Verrucomicrobia bacterium]|jgi:hypothetical protein|nr:hypothetical protein [Verrucomicrobiota bacterium]
MLLRKIFHAFSLRERFLLALILWALLLAWLLSLLDSFQVSLRTWSLNSDLISSFEATLAQAEEAESLLESAREGLDGSKTFSAPQLVGRLDSIARENKVDNFDISSPSTVETELFSFHTVRLSINRSRMPGLISFDQAVKEFSPYIALSEFRLNANKRDPRFLDADFELVSFELKEVTLND